MKDKKEEEKPKKKRKKKDFPQVKTFENKKDFYSAMIHYWEKKKADFIKNGDPDKQRKRKKAEKLVETLKELSGDPDVKDILDKILKGK